MSEVGIYRVVELGQNADLYTPVGWSIAHFIEKRTNAVLGKRRHRLREPIVNNLRVGKCCIRTYRQQHLRRGKS